MTHNDLTLTKPLKCAPPFRLVFFHLAIEKHSHQSMFLQALHLVLAQPKGMKT